MSIPRGEYPRPQLRRENWLCLNGEWDFEIDQAKVGIEKEFYKRDSLSGRIIVPFCPESRLSGVEHTDFMNCVWYRRGIEIPKDWENKNIILHFGAVDYHAIVYVNGIKIGEHKGGYTPFSFDITRQLAKSNYITLCAFDDNRSHNQPCGKQSVPLKSASCSYTRTTGIWQTVWLEAVDKCYIKNIKIDTEMGLPSVHCAAELVGDFIGCKLAAEAIWDGKVVGKTEVICSSNNAFFSMALSEKHLWDIGKGNLYDLKITISKSESVYDVVYSYFGIRSVCLDGRAFKLNGRTVFGRWVLDQGFYPDGVYTAPKDEDLKKDIVCSVQLGFNGARLHEKVFEPRFLYWADRLGYMVWGEYANWELDITETGQIEHFLPEWTEAVERDYNHPSIIGWCPFNETWDFNGKKQSDELVRMVYKTTKALDKTRPVIDTSGNCHVETDIFDVHDYEQDPAEFASHYNRISEGIAEDAVYRNPVYADRQKYDGQQPIFVSEYGGIGWAVGKEGWGYGNLPKSEDEFTDRYKKLTEALLGNPYMLGFCYTQLYDIEQEQNGLMTYIREFKFDPEIFYKINTQPAAIETEETKK